jgi:hypothetical protein
MVMVVGTVSIVDISYHRSHYSVPSYIVEEILRVKDVIGEGAWVFRAQAFLNFRL